MSVSAEAPLQQPQPVHVPICEGGKLPRGECGTAGSGAVTLDLEAKWREHRSEGWGLSTLVLGGGVEQWVRVWALQTEWLAL